jgi:tRNA nucleotidyltransferase (CCA-adding enzyme)
MLAVTGNDLIKAGMKPGKEVGTRLQQFLELVLEDPVRNTKEYLLSLLSSVSDA